MELIAMLILSMACINYINLVSAQRRKRNKSVAVIKMLGSQTWGVVRIFLAEAGLLLLAVLGLSTFLIPFALDLFNRLMETDYTTAIFLLPQNIRMRPAATPPAPLTPSAPPGRCAAAAPSSAGTFRTGRCTTSATGVPSGRGRRTATTACSPPRGTRRSAGRAPGCTARPTDRKSTV